MTNVPVVFEKLDGVTHDYMRKGKINTGYENLNVHTIFDIKVDGKFNRNA